MYGTGQGTIGHFSPNPSRSSFLRKTWELPGSGIGSGGGSVTAISRCDLTQDGVAELVAGREDGTVKVSITLADHSTVGCTTCSPMGGDRGWEQR